ncbi:MAG: hypothetical protein AB1589_18890 [Cyanobacteriota bacterium]
MQAISLLPSASCLLPSCTNITRLDEPIVRGRSHMARAKLVREAIHIPITAIAHALYPCSAIS